MVDETQSFIIQVENECEALFNEFFRRKCSITNGENKKDVLCVLSDEGFNYLGAHYDSDSASQVVGLLFWAYFSEEDYKLINKSTIMEFEGHSGWKFQKNDYSSKVYKDVPLFSGKLRMCPLKLMEVAETT